MIMNNGSLSAELPFDTTERDHRVGDGSALETRPAWSFTANHANSFCNGIYRVGKLFLELCFL